MEKYVDDSWYMIINKHFDGYDELKGVVGFEVDGICVKCKEGNPNFWERDNLYLIDYDYSIPSNHEVFKLIDFEDYNSDEEMWDDNYFLGCLNDARIIIEAEIERKINREEKKYLYDYIE